MSAKERVKLFKNLFKEAGIEDKVFEKIENKCIAMNHLGFTDKDVIDRLENEVKNCLDENEKYRYNFANIADKYDLDISFLD